jgi:methionyl-tRNA formyltransferase
VHACVTVPISASTTGAELRQTLVDVGTRLLVDELRAGLTLPRPQVGDPTYAAKINAEELRIDWSKSPVEIDRLIRLGGAWTTFDDRRLRIVEAGLVDNDAAPSNELRGDRVGGLRVVTVQPEGKSPMPFGAFARGARLGEVERLGDSAPVASSTDG